MIELTNAYNPLKNKILFVNHNSLTVLDISGQTKKIGNCKVFDGFHNNGGWSVEETYEEIKAMIIAANA